MNRFALIAAAGVLVACSAPQMQSANPQRPACADKVAASLSTSDRTVPGAYACLRGRALSTVTRYQIGSDEDLRAAAAADPAYQHMRFDGTLRNGELVYEIWGSGFESLLFLHLDKDGTVDDLRLDNAIATPN